MIGDVILDFDIKRLNTFLYTLNGKTNNLDTQKLEDAGFFIMRFIPNKKLSKIINKKMHQ